MPRLTPLPSIPSGVGSYRINEREVTGEAYENTLKQIGVLVKVGGYWWMRERGGKGRETV